MKRLILAALIGLPLSACATSSNQVLLPSPEFRAPPMPADIVACFESLTPFPAGEALTEKQKVALIIQLRISEIQKSICGRRAIAFHEATAT